MRIFVSGQKRFGREVAALVREEMKLELVGVSCPVEESDKLRRYATAWEIPTIKAGTLSHRNLPDGVDLIIAAHSHDFIGRKTRQKASIGAIGYHPSLLPRHRGRSAIEWAIRMHEPITGGTVFWLSDTVDGGPIAAQDWRWIMPGDDASSLWHRDLFPLGLALIRKTLTDLLRGVLVKVPQDKALVTCEPGIDQPALYRPDLPEIEAPGPRHFRTVVEATGAELATPAPFIDEHGLSDDDLIGACEFGVPFWAKGD